MLRTDYSTAEPSGGRLATKFYSVDAAEHTAAINALRRRDISVVAGATVSTPDSLTSSTGTSRVPYLITVDCTGVRLVYHNFYDKSSGNTVAAGTLDLRGASVWVGGVGYRVTFNGSIDPPLIDPGGVLVSDPLALDLVKGTFIEVRTYIVGGFNSKRYANGPGMGGWISGDQSAADGSAIADNTSFIHLFGPSVILGDLDVAPVKTLVAIGDSITFGMHDGPSGAAGVNTTYDRMGKGGFVARAAITHGMAFLNCGIGGQTAQMFATQAGHYRTMAFVREYDNAVESFGRNDLFASRTLAQLQADVIAVWVLLARKGMRIFRTTLVPDTTSTDGWLTPANQTVKAWETVRVNFNDWLRDGAPMLAGAAVAAGSNVGTAARCRYYNSAGALTTAASGPAHLLHGVCEVADTVESARNSGKWRTPFASRSVDSGTSTANGSVLNAANGGFVMADDLGKVVVLPGAGTSGGTYTGTIKNVFSGTQISVTPNTPTAATAGFTVVDAATFDGTHPHPAAHAAMAAALPVADFR